MTRSTGSNVPAWNYAQNVYARPGAAEACHVLQDRLGVDIVLLLHAMHIFSAEGIALDSPSLIEAETRIGEWRREVIIPLRELRRKLKTAPFRVSMELMERTRLSIKAAELDAEFAAFALLANGAKNCRADPSQSANFDTLLDRVLSACAVDPHPNAKKEVAVQQAIGLLQELLVVGTCLPE